MVPQKPQVWSSCKAHDAMEWQRHFERHATPQMGRNCGFWIHPEKRSWIGNFAISGR